MKPFTLEPGGVYMGLTGPFREIVKIGRQRVEYRVLHADSTRHCSVDQFREWAVSDVTEGIQCPVVKRNGTSTAREAS
jgi:hypothetical protein